MSALSPRQMFLLDSACWPLRNDFPGYGPYLVGTAQGYAKGDPSPRDVDVRHIMRDEEYAAFMEAVGLDGIRFLGLAVGQYLASVTGLPVDFQFQQMTAANSAHGHMPEVVRHMHNVPLIGCRCAEDPSNVTPAQPRPRNPLGVRCMGNYIGDAEPAQEDQ